MPKKSLRCRVAVLGHGQEKEKTGTSGHRTSDIRGEEQSRTDIGGHRTLRAELVRIEVEVGVEVEVSDTVLPCNLGESPVNPEILGAMSLSLFFLSCRHFQVAPFASVQKTPCCVPFCVQRFGHPIAKDALVLHYSRTFHELLSPEYSAYRVLSTFETFLTLGICQARLRLRPFYAPFYVPF